MKSTRRKFFSFLAKAAAVAAIAPKLPFSAAAREECRYIINPEWVSAPYELVFLYPPSALNLPLKPMKFPKGMGEVLRRARA